MKNKLPNGDKKISKLKRNNYFGVYIISNVNTFIDIKIVFMAVGSKKLGYN